MTRGSSFAQGARLVLPVLFGFGLCAIGGEPESWDATFVGGSKIGYTHTYVEKVQDRGKEYLRVRIDMELKLKRDRDMTVLKLQYGTIETLDGQVLRLDTRTQVGEDNDIRGHGDVIRGQMKFQLDGNGDQQSLLIPWGPDVRGPYGPEQSMARKPMKENETRSLKMFIPDLNKIADVTLASQKIEPVVLGDGSTRQLLRVEQSPKVDGVLKPEFANTMWVDSGGQVLKAEQEIFGKPCVTFRTTREGAMAPSGPMKFNLITGTVIKTPRLIPNPEQTQYVKYRLTYQGADVASVIPTDARQTIHGETGQSMATMEIHSAGPLEAPPGSATVDERYLKSNVLVNSQDKRVVAMAKRATRGVVDPWEKAKRINHLVFDQIKQKNFGVGFAAASEVARNMTGDCSEHSVLAAAMCRASGIPSRVVVGLVYVTSLQGFGFHMWYEAYINGRWIALDPSWDETTVDATHIKLSETSLDGVAPFEAFVPIMKISGKLQIEPLEFR
jgi:hypothetical protein